MTLVTVDWATVASLATAFGTLVLALATFSAVRSSNRTARIAESALQEQRRPVLAPSRLEDPMQKIMFLEGHWVSAAGGRAVVEHVDGTVFLAISLRNVGAGIAVCQGWTVKPRTNTTADVTHAGLDEFRMQSRDLYVPAGDIGMWQGALRHPDDQARATVVQAIEAGESIFVELLYTDQVGGQRTISRFGLMPAGDSWLASLTRHWFLDGVGPRSDETTHAAADLIMRERDAAEARCAALERDVAPGPSDSGEAIVHEPPST